MRADAFRTFGIAGGGFFFAILGVANPFFTLYAAELGASTLTIGMMVTLRAILPIFIAMPSGQLIDSIGPMRMLQWGSVFLLTSLLLTVFAAGVPMLALSQLFLGTSIIIMATSLQVLVSAGNRAQRNDSIKRYSMWMSGGGMLGPLIGGALVSQFEVPAEGYRFAFITSTAVTLLFTLAVFWLSRFYRHAAPDDGDPAARDVMSRRGFVDSYRKGIGLTASRPVQFGLIATFIIMYIQSLYMSFLPLFLDEYGYSAMLIAAILSLQGLAGMLSRFIVGRLMARYTLERILTAAGGIASVCVVLTPLAVVNVPAMLALVFVLGAACGINLPVSIMIMVDAIGETQRGKLMGLRLLVNRISQTLSPAMFGLLGHFVGLTAAFFAGGVVLVATMAGFAAYASRRLRPESWIKDEPAE